jgi:hypothetical protein
VEAGHAWALLDPSLALLVRAAVPLVRAVACPSWAQAPYPTSAQDPPSLASTQTVVASHPSDRQVPWRDLPCSLSLGPVASSRVVPSRSALAGDGTRHQRPILEEEPAHGWAALQWQSYSSLCTRLATSVASRSTWYECALFESTKARVERCSVGENDMFFDGTSRGHAQDSATSTAACRTTLQLDAVKELRGNLSARRCTRGIFLSIAVKSVGCSER